MNSSGDFQIVYGSNSVELEITGVGAAPESGSDTPEPGAWFLFASGLTAILVRRCCHG